ncbi:hypothetical protein E1301_Tti022448 [Triplophysa tibetana]|uniref:Uncharacterized protein n=1 Tax=Triplophysa tibetana TaxID=1572043 RepID=A0A5A9NBV3_9TELE|nr:hypothetical protein E1301_Tti022448 [Triplophysa tibetana]
MYFVQVLKHRMAFCKVRRKEFVILFGFTFINLIHCRSLAPLSGTQTNNDDGNKMISEMSDQRGFDEQLADFDPIDDDNVFDETSDAGDKTLSEEQLSDFDYPMEDVTVFDLPRSAVETASDDWNTTLSDMSDQGKFDEQFADFDDPIDDFSEPESSEPESSEPASSEPASSEPASSEPASSGPASSEPESSEPESSEWALLQGQGSEVMHEQFGNSSEGGWAKMSPKLRCGDDLMNLQLFGSDVDQVELCRGSSAPVPLGHLPPDCGRTSPTHGGLVYATPYDGCGVAKQGGNYLMQMLWQGYRVVISCPMA